MNSSIHIRKALASDFSNLNNLLSELGYEIQESDFQKRRKAFQDVLNNPYQDIQLATDGSQKVLGMVSYSVLPQLRLSGLKLEIDELVVSSQSRGGGVGSALVHFIIGKAKELQAEKIFISTNKRRESYQREFYRKLGFHEKNSAFFERSF